jgi:uncharacterized membrane protein YfcA
MTDLLVLVAGLGVGVVFGLFGAGGSAFATPILALIGVPGVVAVASPLPAMLPASIAAARRYHARGEFDGRVARLTMLGGVPGTVIGAYGSSLVGGRMLLVLSGALLGVVGVLVVRPSSREAVRRAALRRERTGLVVAAACAVGFLTGLLANGGGFLLVPLYLIVLGMSTAKAAGTSMVAVGVLAVPTIVAHLLLGHIDWVVAIAFALGLIPGSLVGARLALRVSGPTLRRVFGVTLIVFSAWFLATRLGV